jgi:signal transduction histidine kinase
MARRWQALLNGAELYLLSLLGVGCLLIILASFVPGFGLGMIFLLPPPILFSRRLTGLVRRRLDIPSPYAPTPPPPVRQADGWYRRDRQLYRRSWAPAFMDRTEWLLGDNATWRDIGWMLLTPITGGLLGLLPTVLVAGGLSAPLWAPFPYWLAGLACVLIGLTLAPVTWRASAWYHRRMLGGPIIKFKVEHPVRQWVGRALLPVVRLATLLLSSVILVPVFAVTVLGFLLGYCLGLYFLVPMVLEDLRWVAMWRRSMAKWSGVSIPSPYRPKPPLARGPDGLYQVGKYLYKTERWALWQQRHVWLLSDPATWRELLWRAIDPFIGGVIALIPVGLFAYGVWGLLIPRIIQATFSTPLEGWYGAVAGQRWAAIPAGLLLAWMGIKLSPLALKWHGRWSKLLLGPTTDTVLAQRVEQLTQTRIDATEASAGELRRIERDLHDGAQARLVAVGISLATIERLMDTDPTAARALLAKTRETAATALRELREVVRGIHPPVLAERGLGDAVRALALDSPLSANVTVDLPQRLPDPIEAAAYFAVAEALGNAARHANASAVEILLEQPGDTLRIVVKDNGQGGADPSRGTGLRGLARRLGIFDGIVTIASPPGGPTELTMEIPCASSSPRTSTS